MVSLEKQILYILKHRHVATATELIHIYKERGKTEQTIRNALSSLKQKGYITVTERKYSLSETGFRVIQGLQIKMNRHEQKWDGLWHIVMFSIPEKLRSMRNSFRRELVQIGYGLLYDGVFICPYNRREFVMEFAKQSGLEPMITMMQGSFDNKVLSLAEVERIWPIQAINEKYEQFISWANERKEQLSKTLANNLDVSPWKTLLDVLELGEMFGEILLEDPYLPTELLPKSWAMNRAWDAYEQNLNQLVPLLKDDGDLLSFITPSE